MSVERYVDIIADEFESFDVSSLVKEVMSNKFDHRDPIPEEPDYTISIGGKGIGLPGSVIGVYGPPKSRKSSFMAMIAAACLSKDGKFGHITTKIDGDILWFDTEQSATEVQYFQRNVIRMSKVTDDDNYISNKYHAMKLRPYLEDERVAIIDRILTAPDLFDNVGLIVLDGIADLSLNVNDIETSKKVVTRLTQWADKLGVPIIVALHTNKDGKDATGALGGFLNKKCSYAIKCIPEFEDGPSTVKPYHTRNGKSFMPFRIHNQTDDEEFPGMPKILTDNNDSLFEYFGSFEAQNRSNKVNVAQEEPPIESYDKEEVDSLNDGTSRLTDSDGEEIEFLFG